MERGRFTTLVRMPKRGCHLGNRPGARQDREDKPRFAMLTAFARMFARRFAKVTFRRYAPLTNRPLRHSVSLRWINTVLVNSEEIY